MEIEDKFNRFNITDEMIQNFRYLENISKGFDKQREDFIIKTIIINGEHKLPSKKQGKEK